MDAPGPQPPEPPRLFLAPDPRALEERLAAELAAAPPRDPFTATVVVAPTRRLLDHLSFELAKRRGALAGFHFLHHQSLATHVLERSGRPVPARASDALLESLLVERVARSKLALAGYLAAQPEAIGALRATLRDLRDAGVDAAAAQRAKRLPARTSDVLALLAEHEALVAELERDGATDGAGLARLATRALRDPATARATAARLVHYGAYELIGVNRELVAALARAVPTLLFVAAPPGSERPRELASAFGATIEELSAPAPARRQSLISAAGPREELRIAVRQLLRWHGDDGVPFEEMAILTRGGTAHARALRAEAALLDATPDTSLPTPVAALPDALALRQIVELAADPTSPLLVERVERAAAAADRDPAADRDVARAFMEGDAAGRVGALRDWARQREHGVALAGELDDAVRELTRHARLAALFDARGAAGRDPLARHVLQRLEGARLSPKREAIGRLRVLEFHQARALPLARAVLIGANDRLLPRRAAEDFFLPDDARRALREATGAPIPLRGDARRDDELLFDTVCAGVRDELVVSFARADADDRESAPSPFLRRLGLDAKMPTKLVQRSPRVEIQELRELTGMLTPNEALASAIESEQADAAARALGLDAELCAAGLARIAAIDRFDGDDLRFDGGGVAVAERPAWSPSGIEQLGSCPLQFFFERELGVEADDDAYAGELTGLVLGNLLHGTLCRLYRELLPAGRPIRAAETLPRARGRLAACLEAEAAGMEGFPALAPRFRRLRMEQLARDLLDFVAEDLARCEKLGLRAGAFEAAHEIEIAIRGRPLRLKLRLDRILVDAQDREWIGDYKTSAASKLAESSNPLWMVRGKSLQLPLYRLARAADDATVGGLELLSLRAPRGGDDDRFHPVDLAKLERSDADVADTLDALLELRGSGHFPLWSPPNGAFVRCSHCEFRRACRHAHAPTRERVEHAPAHARFFALVEKSPAKPATHPGGPA